MITEKDLLEAIAECQGQRNPNANTCIKLAAYYTIQDHMHPVIPVDTGSSYAESPAVPDTVILDSDSEFAAEVNGRTVDEIMPIMDELMQVVKVLHPRLYDGTMRRIRKNN